MEPRMELIPGKKLIGKHLTMTLSANRTYELWHSFMPLRKQIKNNLTADLISLQVYDESLDFNAFNAETRFEKWAAVEVSDFNVIPDQMESYTLKGGLYAVFIHKGAAQTFAKTFQYIFGTWLPGSDYTLDSRAHFEILGEKYKNNDPDSEEEVWIPVRRKA
jgi:AraC family transcriptional regulator